MMETTVPYHPGYLLGRAVDLISMKPCFMSREEEEGSFSSALRPEGRLTSQFSYIETLKDVCDVLNIPPEYALKVRVGLVENDVVKICIKALGCTNAFSIVFRTCFVQERKQCRREKASKFSMTAFKRKASRQWDKTTEAAANVTPCHSNFSARKTHWVKAAEIGNEQIVVLKIKSEDTEKLEKLREMIDKSLGTNNNNILDHKKLQALRKTAASIDKKMSKKNYSTSVHLDIHYGYFNELSKYPACISGMVEVLETFLYQCTGYKEMCKMNSSFEVESCAMMCKEGWYLNDLPLRSRSDKTETSLPCSVFYEDLDEVVADVAGSLDSYVVLESSAPQYFYIVRVTLEACHEDLDLKKQRVKSPGSPPPGVYTDETYGMFERLRKFLDECFGAAELFQDFLSKKHWLLDDRPEDANAVLQNIHLVYDQASKAVASLDFLHLPTANTIQELLASNPLEIAKRFIQDVTSKLPPGNDLDLLMIGKTGHGKSATGNSILGQDAFYSAFSAESITSETQTKWAVIDGRTIKVVDTPGVCDTKFTSKKRYRDHALKAMSDAIVSCSGGFDALLLIMSCKIRMTVEEKGAIQMLKSIFGKDIIQSHCIVVFTHGDNFEAESFESWCTNQSGFLKELFEECGNRCVLFNNKTTDPEVKKTQLIQLVAKVDMLREKCPRYTNKLFDLARQQRDRIISEEQKPYLNEHIIRELQWIIANLSDAGQAQNNSELKERVMNLKNWIAEVNMEDDPLYDQISPLYESLCLETNYVTSDTELGVEAAGGVEVQYDDVRAYIKGEAVTMATGGNDDTAATKADSMLCEKEKVLKSHRDTLQSYYYSEIAPQSIWVNQMVGEEVKKEVKNSINCFPGSSTVTLESGERITLSELKVGDKVLVRDSTGALIYDTVYMFGHQDFDTSTEYKVLSTALCDVFVSPGHLVYCIKDGKEQCIAAGKICIGDKVLIVVTPDGLSLNVQPVENISHQRKKGLFAPFTLSGTIVVDNALMSCYVDVLPDHICHRLLSPMRQLYRICPGALTFVNGSTSKHPVPRWVNAALKLMSAISYSVKQFSLTNFVTS